MEYWSNGVLDSGRSGVESIAEEAMDTEQDDFTEKIDR